MSYEICPHCQDFTEQTEIANLQGSHTHSSGTQSSIKISICKNCGQSVELEQINVQSYASDFDGKYVSEELV